MLVVMITARRKRDYSAQAIASVSLQLRDGFEAVLLGDGFRPEAPLGWARFQVGERARGSRRLMRAAMNLFVKSGRDRMLYLEDDILISRNFLEYASLVGIKERWAMVSFHDARIRYYPRSAVVARPTCGFLYSQAFVIGRVVAQSLTAPEMDWETPPRGVTDGNGSDRKLSQLMRRAGFIQYGLQLPSLIKHQGLVSAVTGGLSPARGNPTWAGRDFDCLGLLERKGEAHAR